MISRLLFAGVLAALAGACVTTTTPPHELSVENVRTLRLERVELVLDPAARIDWPQLVQAREQPASAPARPDDMTGAVPEPSPQLKLTPEQTRARAIADLREKARTTVEPALKSTLAGTKPVVARITVNAVKVPTTQELLLVGLKQAPTYMDLRIDFVDARTGAVVMQHPPMNLTTQAGYKLNMGTSGHFSHDPIERMFAGMNDRLVPWLLKT